MFILYNQPLVLENTNINNMHSNVKNGVKVRIYSNRGLEGDTDCNDDTIIRIVRIEIPLVLVVVRTIVANVPFSTLFDSLIDT